MNQTLKLPKVLRNFVDEQVKTKGLKSSDTYIAQLIKEEKKRLGVERLVRDLKAAKESGPPEEMTKELWDARGEALFKKIEKKKSHARKN